MLAVFVNFSSSGPMLFPSMTHLLYLQTICIIILMVNLLTKTFSFSCFHRTNTHDNRVSHYCTLYLYQYKINKIIFLQWTCQSGYLIPIEINVTFN